MYKQAVTDGAAYVEGRNREYYSYGILLVLLSKQLTKLWQKLNIYWKEKKQQGSFLIMYLKMVIGTSINGSYICLLTLYEDMEALRGDSGSR